MSDINKGFLNVLLYYVRHKQEILAVVLNGLQKNYFIKK